MGLRSSESAAPVGVDRLYMSVRADMLGRLVGMISSTVGDTVAIVGVVLPDGLYPATGILAVSGFVVLTLIRRSIIVLMVWLWLICAI